MDWESVDWAALDRLRGVFLQRSGGAGPYWLRRSDLDSYDFTFGRRIAWKWAAVLEQLTAQGWDPPVDRIVDWGCGTGIATRSVLAHFNAGRFREVVLWDHSAAATAFAGEAVRRRNAGCEVRISDPAELPAGDRFILLVSHVLSELASSARDALVALALRADAVLWVEPGTYEDSRALIDVRDALRPRLHCWLPCTHDRACGMQAPGNARHWCHHFARPPTEAFTAGGWAQFGRRLAVDLRSLPYSHLVLDRRAPARCGDPVRIIGTPRVSTGVMRVLRCRADGVAEVEIQRRDNQPLYRTLEKGRHDGRFTWREDPDARVRQSD